MDENELAKIVFESGLKVHRALGAGLLESAYEECLFYELTKQNIWVEKQKALPQFIRKLNWMLAIELICLLKRN